MIEAKGLTIPVLVTMPQSIICNLEIQIFGLEILLLAFKLGILFHEHQLLILEFQFLSLEVQLPSLEPQVFILEIFSFADQSAQLLRETSESVTTVLWLS